MHSMSWNMERKGIFAKHLPLFQPNFHPRAAGEGSSRLNPALLVFLHMEFSMNCEEVLRSWDPKRT